MKTNTKKKPADRVVAIQSGRTPEADPCGLISANLVAGGTCWVLLYLLWLAVGCAIAVLLAMWVG